MSHLLYKHIKDQIKNRLHNPELSTDNLDLWINNARDKMLRDIKPSFLVSSYTFDTVANQSVYNLPNIPIGSIREAVDVDNESPIELVTEQDLNSLDIDRDDGTDIVCAVESGISYIQNQPSAASVLSITSTSALDTTQVAFIRGIVSGIERTESVTLTGTVAALSLLSYTSITSITLSAVCAGAVTVTSNAAAVTNVTIPNGHLYVPHLILTLWGTPDDAYEIRLEYYKSLAPLSNDADPLFIPDDWNSLLIDMSLIEAHRHGYEFQPSEYMVQSVSDQLKSFSNKYQRTRKKHMSMVKDRLPLTRIRSDKPVG